MDFSTLRDDIDNLEAAAVKEADGNAAAQAYLRTQLDQARADLVTSRTQIDALKAQAPAWTVHEGDLTLSKPGFYDLLDVHGFLEVTAKVTIGRIIVRGGPATSNRALLKITDPAAAGTVIADAVLALAVPNAHVDGARLCQPVTIGRIDISGTVDGMVIYGRGVTVAQPVIHDLVVFNADPNQSNGLSHSDCVMVQGGSGHRILGGNLTANPRGTSCVIITQDVEPVTDTIIDSVRMTGGAVSVNLTPKRSFDATVKVTGNVFADGAKAITRRASTCKAVVSGNVDLAGNPAAILNG